MKQNPGKPVWNFIKRKEKIVKIAGLPWSSDLVCKCMDNMYKYTVIRGITNERLKTRIFDNTEVGNNVIQKAKWKDVKEQLIMLDISTWICQRTT